MSHSSIFLILAAVLLPPLPVFLLEGPRSEFIISIVLTILGWIPGMVYALFIVLSGNRYTSKSIKSDLLKNSKTVVSEPAKGISKIDGAELEKSELSGSQRRVSQFVGSSDEVPAIEPISELSPMRVNQETKEPEIVSKETETIEPKEAGQEVVKEAVSEPIEAPQVVAEGSAPSIEEGQITEDVKDGKKKSYFGIFKK